MEIEKQYLVYVRGHWQILYYANGRCFLTSKGGFGQLDYMLEEISAKEAIKILKEHEIDLKINTNDSDVPVGTVKPIA